MAWTRPPGLRTITPKVMGIDAFKDMLTNPFKVDGTEGALADDMRIKALFDFAYGAAVEDFFSYLRMELSILLRTPLAVIRRTGR